MSGSKKGLCTILRVCSKDLFIYDLGIKTVIYRLDIQNKDVKKITLFISDTDEYYYHIESGVKMSLKGEYKNINFFNVYVGFTGPLNGHTLIFNLSFYL